MGDGMKKVLIGILALAFAMPVGIGMFGGGSPPPIVRQGQGGGDDDEATRQILAGIARHCATVHKDADVGTLERCERQQTGDAQRVLDLLHVHKNNPAGPKIEACLVQHVPAADTADWSAAMACAQPHVKP